MNTIGARQIKAARALLDWSQDDLSVASSLSIATIRKLELGYISPRHKTSMALFRAFGDAGVEFLDGEGVRKSKESLQSYEGVEACSSFFEDLLHTVQKRSGEVLLVVSSTLNDYLSQNIDTHNKLERLIKKIDGITVRILVSDSRMITDERKNFEYRSLPLNYVEPVPYCVYGDKYALLDVMGQNTNRIVIVQSKSISLSSRRQFYSMWDKALCAPDRTVSF